MDTPFDFTTKQYISDLKRLEGAIDGGGKPGIDHAYVIVEDQNVPLALFEVASLSTEKRTMQVMST